MLYYKRCYHYQNIKNLFSSQEIFKTPSISPTAVLLPFCQGRFGLDVVIVMIGDCRSIITECEFTARWALIEGYHTLGKRILQEHNNFERQKIYGKDILQCIAKSLDKSKSTIYSAARLYEQEPREPNDSYRLGLYVKRWVRWVGTGLDYSV